MIPGGGGEGRRRSKFTREIYKIQSKGLLKISTIFFPSLLFSDKSYPQTGFRESSRPPRVVLLIFQLTDRGSPRACH